MSRKVLLVTPTYNERDNLETFISSIHASQPEAHVLVVDDNSPDGTGKIADDIAARDSRVNVMHRPGKMGLGTAYVQGFGWGIDRGYDIIIQIDADLSHDPRYLADMFRAFDEGADLVIGSRNIPGGTVDGWGPGRHFISKGGSTYARTILGLPVRDLTSGYKAYRRELLEAIHLETIRSVGYSFQIEVTYRAIRKGFRVKEVPIIFVDRRAGKSKMSRRIFVEAAAVVWKLRADAIIGKI